MWRLWRVRDVLARVYLETCFGLVEVFMDGLGDRLFMKANRRDVRDEVANGKW